MAKANVNKQIRSKKEEIELKDSICRKANDLVVFLFNQESFNAEMKLFKHLMSDLDDLSEKGFDFYNGKKCSCKKCKEKTRLVDTLNPLKEQYDQMKEEYDQTLSFRPITDITFDSKMKPFSYIRTNSSFGKVYTISVYDLNNKKVFLMDQDKHSFWTTVDNFKANFKQI